MGLAPKKDQRYTVEDYLSWPEDGPRYELIEGVPYELAAPGYEHQKIVADLHVALALYLREYARAGGGDGWPPCEVLLSPLDLVLSDITTVQPDLMVLCDPSKIKNGRIYGAPDLVVEVLSPSGAAKDRKHKRRLYELAGVPQFLLIDPANRFIELYSLNAAGRYDEPAILDADDGLTLNVAPGFNLTLAQLFSWPTRLEIEQEMARYVRV